MLLPTLPPLAPRLFRCFLLLTILLVTLTTCGLPPATPTTYRIGFAQCSNQGPWRQAMLAGMERELAFHPEVTLRMRDAHDDSQLQQQQIRELLRDGLDLLIVSPYEEAPLAAAVAEAYQQGVPVLLLDRKTTSPHYTAYVGGNNVEVGQTAARYAAQLLRQQGQVIEVLGTPGSSATAGRHQGFMQQLAAYPNLHVAGQVTGNWNKESLKPALAATLRAHPAASLIFAHNDAMAQGAYEVCRQLGRAHQIRILGVDGMAGPGGGLDQVQRGRITASLLYAPGGEEAIRTVLKILHGQPYTRENTLGTIVIDSTNVLTLQQQAAQFASQQQGILRQQWLLRELQSTYASQRVVLYGLLATLLVATGLGTVAWQSARKNRRVNQQLAWQNAENDAINRQLSQQNEEIRTQRNQLETLAAQARADTEAKLRFFTNFSHELRTPLTLILGPVEEMLTASPTLSDTQRHDLGLVRRNTQRLLQLVNQLLDFRKLDVGKMPVRATEGDLVAFVRELVDVFEQPARLRNIQLRLRTSEPNLRVWFDPNVLDKVLLNLLSNALKFTPDSGQITVSLNLLDHDHAVQVSVADTGCGIQEEDRAHIFEWFYQGVAGNTGKGSGMGLALAQGLVRLHQGQLTYRSQPGAGSNFTVTLPRELPTALRVATSSGREPFAQMPAAPATELLNDEALAPLPATAAATPIQVLVIEDNPEVNEFVARKLRTHFQVHTATDGYTGLQLATELIPDLIVCDVMMPGLSGLEVVAQLRADWRTSHILVVLLTARHAPEQHVEGVQAGADLYLTKPFNPTFLRESIRTLLANRAHQREHTRRELTATPPPTPPTPDQQFIANLTAVVETNLAQTDLTVEDVAHRLGISRMQLYRKVKAVLGTGVTDFIQHVRLTKARHLLLDETRSIVDVAYEVGFSSHSYFSSSFKARYHVSPTEFRALQLALAK